MDAGLGAGVDCTPVSAPAPLLYRSVDNWRLRRLHAEWPQYPAFLH